MRKHGEAVESRLIDASFQSSVNFKYSKPWPLNITARKVLDSMDSNTSVHRRCEIFRTLADRNIRQYQQEKPVFLLESLEVIFFPIPSSDAWRVHAQVFLCASFGGEIVYFI
jgi:hypothetical protein